MIIFRPHRRTLDEAMDDVKEFNTVEEMKEYIVEQWRNRFDVEDVVIGVDSVNDDRIGWEDSRYVCIKRLEEEDYIKLYGHLQCVGMCATKYSKSK